MRKQGDWLVARIGGECVLMNRQAVRHIAVGEVGARIWELMESVDEVDNICARLRREYDVPAEECRAQVGLFLNELAGPGAVGFSV